MNYLKLQFGASFEEIKNLAKSENTNKVLVIRDAYDEDNNNKDIYDLDKLEPYMVRWNERYMGGRGANQIVLLDEEYVQYLQIKEYILTKKKLELAERQEACIFNEN